MRRFSGLHALVLSFFSPALYRDVALQWRGIGVLYLLLVATICAIPRLVMIQL